MGPMVERSDAEGRYEADGFEEDNAGEEDGAAGRDGVLPFTGEEPEGELITREC